MRIKKSEFRCRILNKIWVKFTAFINTNILLFVGQYYFLRVVKIEVRV